MADKEHRVTFLPENKSIRVEHLKTIFETIGEENPEDIQLFFSCGAEGICQKCKVRSLQAMGPLTATEKGCLSDEELARGVRLACQARVVQDSQVEIQYKRPFTIALTDEPIDFQGSTRLQKIALSSGTNDQAPGAGAIMDAALEAGVPVPTDMLEAQAVSCLARTAGEHAPVWTAVFFDGSLVALEPGDTRDALYAVAVDLGTNTLEVSLVDVGRVSKIGVVIDSNPQIELGDTYEARLGMVAEDELNLDILNEEIILRIDILIHELCAACKVPPAKVYEILVAGSTGMLHLFLMRAPAQPGHSAGLPERLTASQLDLHSVENAGITLLPVIGPAAGANMTAALLAAGFHRGTETQLLLDLGGSAKAVLYHGGRLFASAVDRIAVLEGSGLHCGMRPETGAVCSVRMAGEGDLEIGVVGESLARGVCGSGLLELAACLRDAGMLDEDGSFMRDPAGCAGPLKNRLHMIGDEPAIVLFSDTGEFETDICVTGRDMSKLFEAGQRVAAMLEHVCKQAGAAPGDISRVLVSGALGGPVSGDVLGTLGFVPPVLAGRAVFIGNASKLGVQLALLDAAMADEAVHLARDVAFMPFSADNS